MEVYPVSLYTRLVRPVLFRMDPERAHERAIRLARRCGSWPIRGLLGAWYGYQSLRLETEVAGIRFPNPLGLAAGFDKSGVGIRGLAALGFGHIEIGSISAERSQGNPKPRLFRIPEDRGIVVHYGLPNDGARAVATRLRETPIPVPLGVNIVKTNRGLDAPCESDDAVLDDYVRSVRLLADHADYLSLNLSCPNTETGRDFFADRRQVVHLLSALLELPMRRPVFLKISPLGGTAALESLLQAVEGFPFIAGFAFNLAPGKPENLRTSRHLLETMPGAVAGKPVDGPLNDCIRDLYRRMDTRRYRIIGIGGVFSAEDAYRKIRLGASLVQLLTGMVYEGPALIRRIQQGLCRLLDRDGFTAVGQAVGTANR
jgi:dihydroorotate dehydrogenase (fumarate)/dihydroorotate dehydrogenase